MAEATGDADTGLYATAPVYGVRTYMDPNVDNEGIRVSDGRRGIRVQNCRIPLAIRPYGAVGPPTAWSFPSGVGDVYVDGAGTLYYCVQAGYPGKWRRLSGPDTAGAFTAIDPARVYDSRFGAGPLGSGQSRLVGIANQIDVIGGAPVMGNIVPVGTTAIQYNLTVTDTVGSGYLQIAPGDSTGVTSSSINWTASGQTIANGLSVKVDSNRMVKATVGPGATDFVIDVLGYYR